MRQYTPNWEQYGIDKERYLELLHMCRQYPLWQRKLSDLSGIQALKMDSEPHATGISDPVARLAEMRERFLRKVDLIDQCARDVGDGSWARALIQNVCYRQAYIMIDPLIMPSANRNAFWKHRKEFFILLNERAEKKD